MTEQERQFSALVAKLEPKIRTAFLEAIRKHGRSIDIKAMTEALERGDIARAAELARIRPQTLFGLSEAIRAAFIEGGALAAQTRGLRGAFAFDGRHREAEAWFSQHAASLIQGISDESVDVARATIAERVGRVPSSVIAADIVGRKVGQERVGGMVGLTSGMADSINGARAKLATGDYRAYLRLKLRDKRFDRMIKEALRTGKPLTAARINQIITAHKQKALTYRGNLIARNEAHTALEAGRYESYRQMIETGAVESVTKKWMHGLSSEPRVEHLAMDGTVIPFDQAFVFSDAAMQYPHDPAGGAAHSIGCKCVCFYRVTL